MYKYRKRFCNQSRRGNRICTTNESDDDDVYHSAPVTKPLDISHQHFSESDWLFLRAELTRIETRDSRISDADEKFQHNLHPEEKRAFSREHTPHGFKKV